MTTVPGLHMQNPLLHLLLQLLPLLGGCLLWTRITADSSSKQEVDPLQPAEVSSKPDILDCAMPLTAFDLVRPQAGCKLKGSLLTTGTQKCMLGFRCPGCSLHTAPVNVQHPWHGLARAC